MSFVQIKFLSEPNFSDPYHTHVCSFSSVYLAARLVDCRVCVSMQSDVEKKKHRLRSVTDKLLSSLPGRQRVDLSYLLQSPRSGKRQTKKPAYLEQFLDTSRHSRDSDAAAPPPSTWPHDIVHIDLWVQRPTWHKLGHFWYCLSSHDLLAGKMERNFSEDQK